MNIPALWMTILVACALAVPLLLRIARVRVSARVPRQRLMRSRCPSRYQAGREAGLGRGR